MALCMASISPKARFWIKEVLISSVIFAVVFLGVRFFEGERQRGCGGDLPKGELAASFTLQDLMTGENISLKDLRGKAVVVNFWATWCGVCRKELPALQSLHEKAGDRYRVITVADDNPSALKAVARRMNLTIPILHDKRGGVGRTYKVTKIPKTVILNREGQIVHDFVGPIDEEILLDSLNTLTSK